MGGLPTRLKHKGWVFYKRGKKGTKRYGCSQAMSRKLKMKVGWEVRTVGRCPKGYAEKFVGKW